MTTSFDPGDASMVEQALLRSVQVLYPHARLATAPRAVTAATSTWVWLVDLAGEGLPDAWRLPLVLRIFRPAEAAVAERDDHLSSALLAHGYPAAGTVWRGEVGDAGNPCVLQQRLSGRPAIDALGSPHLRRVVVGLAGLQATLHHLPTGAMPLETMSAERYLLDDLGRRRAAIDVVDPTGGFEWLQRTAPTHEVPPSDYVVCHGDFHPLNALVADDGSIGIVDWTDACIADRHHDVGRTTALYWFASIVAGSRAERLALRTLRGWLVRTHVRAYETAGAVALDPAQLAWWQNVHLYRGWLQLAALEEGAVDGPQSSTTQRFPPTLRDTLLQRCVALRPASER